MDRRTLLQSILALGAVSALPACGKEEAPPAPEPAKPEAPTMDKELKIYNWSDYIAEDTIAKFEAEFGVKVTYDTYESNEELIAKLQAGASGYDLVCPSGYAVQVMLALNLLEAIDAALIPNLGNVAAGFRNPIFDPAAKHTVPWQWGITGIAYRKDKLAAAPDSWGVFLDPKHAGKMTMMDDMRDVIGAWLRYKGFSANSKNPEEIAAAKAVALEAKKHLQSFISAPVKAQLVAGDVHVAQLWNGDTAQATVEQPEIAWVLPKEGGSIWVDSMAIPKGAKNRRAAHAFLDFVLRPEISAAIATFTGYGSPNEKALALQEKPVPFPTAEELTKLEFQIDLGEASALWDQAWTEIKAG